MADTQATQYLLSSTDRRKQAAYLFREISGVHSYTVETDDGRTLVINPADLETAEAWLEGNPPEHEDGFGDSFEEAEWRREAQAAYDEEWPVLEDPMSYR